MKTFLKVKLKHLAQEIRVIKFEESRSIDALRTELYNHRVKVVSPEIRAAQLAYGFLRGRSFREMERGESFRDLPLKIRNKTFYMVMKYGIPYFQSERQLERAFENWISK